MRQVATQMYVKELLDGVYEMRDGWEPNVLYCSRGEVSRCNIIGTFIRSGSEVLLDDGTGKVSLRSYEEVVGLDTSSGTLVQVIARPRAYQGSVFLVAELIKPVDTAWAAVRKASLGEVLSFDSSSVSVKTVAPVVEASSEEQNNAERIVDIISGLDDGGGASIEEVLSASKLGELGEEIINQLLLDGEIFEIKPGVLKVL
ncbi:MAG: hypothetical protein ACMXYD_04840 [Candidatus Woesearchaeota archaeon]